MSMSLERAEAEAEADPENHPGVPTRIVCVIPEWTQEVLVHTNAIDGTAPRERRMTPKAFVLQQDEVFRQCKREGRGEWDVLIYALAKKVPGYVPLPLQPWRRHIYGTNYCILNGSPSVRLSKLGGFSYMDVSDRPKMVFIMKGTQ